MHQNINIQGSVVGAVVNIGAQANHFGDLNIKPLSPKGRYEIDIVKDGVRHTIIHTADSFAPAVAYAYDILEEKEYHGGFITRVERKDRI